MIQNIPIYLIYLPNRKQRWEPTLKNLNDNKVYPILYQGIDGIDWKLKTDLSENKYSKKFTSGRLGCFLSHFMLWNHLSHVDKSESIIILEDDVRIDTDFKSRFDEVFKQLPSNWDFVYLGCEWIPFNPDDKYSENLLIGKPFCTHAYMINKKTIPILMNSCSLLETYLDIQIMEKVLPKVNHYVVDPVLVKQQSLTDMNDYKSLCKDWKTFL